MGAEQSQPNPYQEVHVQMGFFANVLIENGTRLSPSWRRAMYEVPADRVARVYSTLLDSAVGALMYRPGEIIPQHQLGELSAEEYDRYGLDERGLERGTEPVTGGVPLRMQLLIDEDKPATAESGQPVIDVDLRMVHDERYAGDYLTDQTAVKLGHTIGSAVVTRTVYMLHQATSGYEGHSFEKVELSPDDLSQLLKLFKENIGRLIPQLTYAEEERLVVYRCVDSGKIFRYDPERETHVSEDGITKENYVSPLYGLEDQFIDPDNPPKIREVNSLLRYIPKEGA